MIDEKKITEAVDAYIGYPKELGEGVETSMRRDAFKAGVEWFKNALWHERDEEPTEEGVIAKYIAHDDILDSAWVTCQDWVVDKKYLVEYGHKIGASKKEIEDSTMWIGKGFDKWCYLADLLPKGGEE